MTAHELARMLLDGPDLPVHATHSAGDYWHTILAPKVKEVTSGLIVHSTYHNTDKLCDEDGNDKDPVRVILLG